MDLEKIALQWIEANYGRLSEIGKDIWAHAELGIQENYAADVLTAELVKYGFAITRPIGQQPSAFVAEWGSGRPIIGILGELDALAGLSQKMQFTKEPLIEGAPGHGCGHNLLATGALGAAIAVREAMEQAGLKGTVRYYGCPAEETLIGKVYMAREGVYDDLDAAITWHPWATNCTTPNPGNALNSFIVHYHGVAAHGAAAPHMGKSALDGAVLMDVGVQYLREHVEQEVRMHCVITEGGGAPNIVPPQAAIWYYCRAPRREMVDRVYGRMLDCAKGAAIMSDTTYDIEFLTGCHEQLYNHALCNLMQEKMEKLGGPGFTAEEKAFAAELVKTVEPAVRAAAIKSAQEMAGPGVTLEELADPAQEKVLPPRFDMPGGGGSSDVGDVSKIAPTSALWTACFPLGTAGHSWQTVVASGSDFGVRGTVYAAKVMAMGALDLFTKPELLEAAKAEFLKTTGGKKYVSPLPPEAYPHLPYA